MQHTERNGANPSDDEDNILELDDTTEFAGGGPRSSENVTITNHTSTLTTSPTTVAVVAAAAQLETEKDSRAYTGRNSNLSTPVSDWLGASLKVLNLAVSLISMLGNFTYLNDVLSRGMTNIESVAVYAIPLTFWAHAGTKNAVGMALATGAAALGCLAVGAPVAYAPSAGLSVTLGLLLYSIFNEGVQDNTYRVMSMRSIAPINAMDRLQGASAKSIIHGLLESLKGRLTTFDLKKQEFTSDVSMRRSVATLGALGLAGFSLLTTIQGFLNPLLASFKIREDREEIGKTLVTESRKASQENVDARIAALTKLLLQAAVDEANGKLTASAGFGPEFEKKVAFYEAQTGHTINPDDDQKLVEDESFRQSLINMPPKSGSPLDALKTKLIQSGNEQETRKIAERLNQGHAKNFITSPQQHQDAIGAAIKAAQLALVEQDSKFSELTNEHVNNVLKPKFEALEKESQRATGRALKLPELQEPQVKQLDIQAPTFTFPTFPQMWDSWVKEFGGGARGRALAFVQLVGFSAIAASMDLAMILMNINWARNSQKFSTWWRGKVGETFSSLADGLATESELTDYRNPVWRQAAQEQYSVFRYFTITFPYAMSNFIRSMNFEGPKTADLIPPNNVRTVESLRDWYSEKSLLWKLLTGRIHYGAEVQVPITQERFRAFTQTLKSIDKAVEESLNGQDIGPTTKESIRREMCYLVIRRADQEFYTWRHKAWDYLRGEAPDWVIVSSFKGKKMPISYYKMEALCKALSATIDDLNNNPDKIEVALEEMVKDASTIGTRLRAKPQANPKRGELEGRLRNINFWNAYFKGEDLENVA